MKSTIAVCRTNYAIANDYYRERYNNTQATRDATPIFTKKKSDVTLAYEASERRYVSRTNVCGTCNMLVPVGTKVCDNCS